MTSRIALALALVLALVSHAHAAQPLESTETPIEMEAPSARPHIATDAPAMFLEVGDVAPAFSYLDLDGAWRPFEQLFERGPVLLVFAASDDDLRTLERARPALVKLGVTPVAATDRRSGSIARLKRRLGLNYLVFGDARCAIASLFNSLNPLTHRHAPSHFVLDEAGRVRLLAHGPLPRSAALVATTARGLGKPLPHAAIEVPPPDAAE